MNCGIYRKKLKDLIEGDVAHDMKTALEHHTEKCSDCKELYNMELKIDKIFKDAFCINNVSFTSSRTEIMKLIDKNRYGKSAGKKLYFHLKKYTARYLSCAAIIVFAAAFAPFALNAAHPFTMNKNKSFSISNGSMSNSVPKTNMKSYDIADAQKAALKTEEKFTPAFTKIGVRPNVKMPESNTPWISSPSKKLSACIEGRGAEAQNEGVGTIYVKDTVSGGVWMVNAALSNEKYTPMHLEWWDDENVLVVMGYAYGTLSRGGSLYLLNVETAEVSPVYIPPDDKRQVISGKKLGNKVQLDTLVYEDDNYNRSHSEEIICDTDMEALVRSNSKDLYSPELKVMYDFTKFVNHKDYNSAIELLAPALKGASSMDNWKPLKNITSMNITKLVEEPEWGVDKVEETYYTHKVYYAEIYYTVKDESYSNIKNDIYYHKIVIVKVNKDSPWTIAEMSASPAQ